MNAISRAVVKLYDNDAQFKPDGNIDAAASVESNKESADFNARMQHNTDTSLAFGAALVTSPLFLVGLGIIPVGFAFYGAATHAGALTDKAFEAKDNADVRMYASMVAKEALTQPADV